MHLTSWLLERMPWSSILKGFLVMQTLGQCLRLWVLFPLSWLDFGSEYSAVWLCANESLILPHYCIFLFIIKIFNIIEPCSLCVALRNIHVQGYQLAWVVFLSDGVPASHLLFCRVITQIPLCIMCVVFCTMSYQRTVLFWNECIVFF